MIVPPEILLTVVMPVYNGERYLNTAIDSILIQTFTLFEFLIINDGSTDRSEEIIKSYSDPRISYIKNEKNKGLITTLNIGLARSKGKYIARMDSDDVSLPNRLKVQLNYMLSHPQCKLCGTRAIVINEDGKPLYKIRRPTLNKEIKVRQLFKNSFIHPSVMLDAGVARRLKYSFNYEDAEDYYLFSQIVMDHQVANLKRSLIYYRVHPENITSKKQDGMNKSEIKTMHFLLSMLFEKEVSDEEASLHHAFLTRHFENINSDRIEAHLLKIKNANEKKQTYDPELLAAELQNEWFNFLFFSKEKNALSTFINSNLFSIKRFSFRQFIKLIGKN